MEKHNQARANHIGTPPVTYSTTLAAGAQEAAQSILDTGLSQRISGIGQNTIRMSSPHEINPINGLSVSFNAL